MTDANYVNDLALLTNTPTQTEYLLHGLKKASRNIDLNQNTDKTEFMWDKKNKDDTISTLSGQSLKLVD